MTINLVTEEQASGIFGPRDNILFVKLNEIITALNQVSGDVSTLSGDVSTLLGIVGSGDMVLTAEGGVAVKMTNKTGADTVKGTVVEASDSVDRAFDICPADELDPIGVVYEAGVPDGSEALVVMYGIAEVLLEDGTASTRENWVGVSASQAGRANATTAAPPGLVLNHFREMGHCLESKIAGTNVLAKIMMHFN